MSDLRGMETVPVAPRFYSVAKVAELLGMSPMTVYRAIAAGEFPAVRIRGRLIVPAKAIEAIADLAIAEQTVVDASGWVPVQHGSAG
ncbi:MAG: helix-turn-helix domain-containing protein [Actinomycetota bacterium]